MKAPRPTEWQVPAPSSEKSHSSTHPCSKAQCQQWLCLSTCWPQTSRPKFWPQCLRCLQCQAPLMCLQNEFFRCSSRCRCQAQRLCLHTPSRPSTQTYKAGRSTWLLCSALHQSPLGHRPSRCLAQALTCCLVRCLSKHHRYWYQ